MSEGRKIVIRADARPNYLTWDFPGWGDPNYTAHLQPLASIAGTVGVVTSVESHGSNPWTRYSVRLANGGSASGLVPGEDFDWA